MALGGAAGVLSNVPKAVAEKGGGLLVTAVLVVPIARHLSSAIQEVLPWEIIPWEVVFCSPRRERVSASWFWKQLKKKAYVTNWKKKSPKP